MKKSIQKNLLQAERILVHIVVFGLLIVLVGKLWFVSNPTYNLLFVYGISVTVVILITFFIALVLYEDPYEKAIASHKNLLKKPLVTCLIAVHNEEDNIERCISSFINQDYPNCEIIFIDDASTDRTVSKMKPFVDSGKIRLIELGNNAGKKRALAQGLLQAKGEIFAFSDSDCILAPDAISKTVVIINSDPDIGAISGHCRALNADENLLTKIQDSWYEGQFSVRKAFESYFGCVSCVSGPLAVFRREAIYNYIQAWMEDVFLGQEFKFATDRTLTGFVLGSKYVGDKLKIKYATSPFVTGENHAPHEWKVVYSKAAKAWTIVPDSFRKVMKQQIRWKKSFIRNIFFTGTFYWRKPILPVIFYYSHVILVFAGPFIVLRHLVFLPITGNFYTGLLYLAGIAFVGFCYGLAYKMENPTSHKWIYRPLMSLFSTLILCWLLFYSIATIRKMKWHRG